MVAAGVLAGSLIFQRLARQNSYPSELASQIILWSVLWGIAGGRLLHVAVQFPYYYRNPFEIISIRNGGLAAEGAVLSALAFIILYSKIKQFNLRKTLDMIAVPVPLAQAMGRLGCFLNGCCWGKPSNVPWAVKFPYLPARVHPTQLYYAASHILLFILLLTLYKKKLKDGMVFSAYIMCFALIRYTIDNFRGDLLISRYGLYPTQVIALLMFVIGIIWFISSVKQPSEVQRTEISPLPEADGCPSEIKDNEGK